MRSRAQTHTHTHSTSEQHRISCHSIEMAQGTLVGPFACEMRDKTIPENFCRDEERKWVFNFSLSLTTMTSHITFYFAWLCQTLPTLHIRSEGEPTNKCSLFFPHHFLCERGWKLCWTVGNYTKYLTTHDMHGPWL